jgi:hypothetical protein
MTHKGGLSYRIRSMCKNAYVGELGGTFLEIQWVTHTYGWKPKTLMGILGLGKMWLRKEQNGRDYRKYP